ncbi:MAG: translation elongation factor 4 [Clostridiales bacterium]|nr:translation elongation factor 4 [Clostridiales bacterium]
MDNNEISNIRNFCIIAHIDHGKSTLADRMIQNSGLLEEREMQEQILDSMDLERERGITIKSQAIRLNYKFNNKNYVLNLIDTPGHIDFNYEVSRSLAACEGAILLIDAAQGIEAQTLTNLYLALENNLEVICVINKIDLPSANPEKIKKEIEEIICLDASEVPLISAKNNINIDKVFENIIKLVPAPKGLIKNPLRALIFDSKYDTYKGVIVFIRVFDGIIKKKMTIKFLATQKNFEINDVGILEPGKFVSKDLLKTGEVGYFTASIKNVRDTQIGDTVTDFNNSTKEILPGYKKVIPMVYCGLYTADNSKYNELKDALEKLSLNDASLTFEPESSIALGFGFRCGFLGLLHLEIIQERLEREYNLDLITTAPGVIYKFFLTDKTITNLSNPREMPNLNNILYIQEPFVHANIISPQEYIGSIIKLCQERRGKYLDMIYLDKSRVKLVYDMPLNEIIYDFFDTLKSCSRGYASLDYNLKNYETSDLVKLNILINHEIIDSLSFIVHRSNAYTRGKKIVEKLKTLIPRQLFEVPIQASINNKIIARETVSAVRKDVLSKCYGGDISRKRKLLEKQKEGKKRMRQIGNIEIPQSAFMSVLKLD